MVAPTSSTSTLEFAQCFRRSGFPGLLVIPNLVRVGPGPGGIGGIIGHFIVIHKLRDGRRRGECRQLFDLIGRAAEPGTVEQMGRRIIVPMPR